MQAIRDPLAPLPSHTLFASLPPPCSPWGLAALASVVGAGRAQGTERGAERRCHLRRKLLGKNYDGDLAIEDWNNLGGGLIVAPISHPPLPARGRHFSGARPAASSVKEGA